TSTTTPSPLFDIDSLSLTEGVARNALKQSANINSPVLSSSPSSSALKQSSSNLDNSPSASASWYEPPGPIIRSGYLLKKGGNRHNWKKRWFVLDATRIQYFENEASFQVSIF